MSAIINIHFKECKVKLTRLTKEEIEKYTGKTYNGLEEITDSTSDRKPIIFVRRDILTISSINIHLSQDTDVTSDVENNGINNVDINEIQDTEDTSNVENDGINNVEKHEIQDTEDTSDVENDDINDMEINETQDTEDTSDVENDGINDMEINETQDTEDTSDVENDGINDMEINETQDTEDTSDVENDGINDMEINETQDTENKSDIENDFIPFIPNINTPPYIQNDGINNVEINGTQVADNMYAGSSGLMPNMIFQQYGTDVNTTGGNDYIYNQTSSYNPNIMIKQEIQDDSYDTDTLQVAGSSHVIIKQEVIDEGYDQSYNQDYNQDYNQSYITQGDHNMYGEYIPNNQPTQNFGMQSYINPETSNITNGSNSHVIIKQEILDEGNIETYMYVNVEILFFYSHYLYYSNNTI